MLKFSLKLKPKKFVVLSRKGYKVLFFGTDDFSKVILNGLNLHMKFSHRNERIVDELGVVTLSTKQNQVYDYGIKHNLTMFQYPDVPSNFDIGVLASFGKLLPKEIIDVLPKGIINVHPSLLPELRGASPIASAILKNYTETGVSIMNIQPDKFDCGNVLSQTDPIKIPLFIACPELTELLADYGSHLLIETLKALDYRKLKAIPQKELGDATYSKKFLSKHVFFEVENVKASEIIRHVCAHGHMKRTGVYISAGEHEVRLYNVCLPPPADMLLLQSNLHHNPCGVEYSSETQILYVNTASVPLGIKSLALKGKKKITAKDFFNGYVQNEENFALNLEKRRRKIGDFKS